MKNKFMTMLPLLLTIMAEFSSAEDKPALTLDTVEVIGMTPLQGSGIPIDKVPVPVKTVNARQLQESQSQSLADYLNRYLGSVNINDAQNNPFQPDVQFRGFTASPLMGLPQGLSVYVNSIRFNEFFGDTVNWDLIPSGAIDQMSLQSGSNPAFGLNSLGGAIAIRTKTGFTAPKHQLEVSGGSWGRHSEEISSGWNNGTFGYFLDVRYFNEDGWRDFSNTEVMQGFSTFSWRGEVSKLDLTLATADNSLKGNGTIPVELLRVDRAAVFTHPDQTINRFFLASLDGSTWLNDHIELSGNMYFRRNKTGSLNGDGSEFTECAVPGTLCEEDGTTQVLDLAGNTIAFSDAVDGGTRNTSTTIQRSFGFALQAAFDYRIFNRDNHFTFGSTYDQGNVHFSSDTELGALNSSRGVNGSGILTEEARVRLNTETEHFGVFFTDTLSLTDQLDITFSGRYNHTRTALMDQQGTELNGEHEFSRFNPSIGLTYQFIQELTFYGNYSESARAPTPMELSCSDPAAPCKLPNSFVSDPPLKQVVAHTWEAGFRGHLINFLDGHLNWNAGVFRTINDNDIIFQSTGGVVSNAGYFSNVGTTRRQGIELGLNGDFFDSLRVSANYTYLEATFRTGYLSNSPSHPSADANGDIQVRPGNFIPGIPKHLFKFAVDYDVLRQWTVGTDLIYNGSQFLRGDENNSAGKINAYAVVNLRTEIRFNEHIALFGRVTNLFDTEYKNFGQYANTGDVLDALGVSDANSQFVGIGAPRAGWVGIRLSL